MGKRSGRSSGFNDPGWVRDSRGVISGYAKDGIFAGADIPYLERVLWTHEVNTEHNYKLTFRCTRCGSESPHWVKSDNYSTYKNSFFCKKAHWLGAPYDHLDCGLGCSRVSFLELAARAILKMFTGRPIFGYMIVSKEEQGPTYVGAGRQK